MTANVFGTPIYVTSADGTDNASSGKKSGNRTDKIKEVLKALQPLEKTISSLEAAEAALDGTGYDKIKNAIGQLKNMVDAQQDEIFNQITGGQQLPKENAQQAVVPKQNSAPTAGQISGREPLSDDQPYL
jgi:hypothetical protein